MQQWKNRSSYCFLCAALYGIFFSRYDACLQLLLLKVGEGNITTWSSYNWRLTASGHPQRSFIKLNTVNHSTFTFLEKSENTLSWSICMWIVSFQTGIQYPPFRKGWYLLWHNNCLYERRILYLFKDLTMNSNICSCKCIPRILWSEPFHYHQSVKIQHCLLVLRWGQGELRGIL